jgi:multidrug efflux pump subunit AcrB
VKASGKIEFLKSASLSTRMIGYPGASASEVESRVIKPLEKVLSNIKGLEHLQSMAMNGQAKTIVPF